MSSELIGLGAPSGTRSTGWPDGRQVQKRVGPAWTERGRPPAGYFTRRTAEAWLRDVLDQARRGTLPGLIRSGRPSPTRPPSTCATPSTTPAASHRRCATTARRSLRICSWLSGGWPSRTSIRRRSSAGGPGCRRRRLLARRTSSSSSFTASSVERRRCMGSPTNPMANIERHRQRSNGDIQLFSVEEVLALVRAAESEQDAAM
jgi:hypothetical protein